MKGYVADTVPGLGTIQCVIACLGIWVYTAGPLPDVSEQVHGTFGRCASSEGRVVDAGQGVRREDPRYERIDVGCSRRIFAPWPGAVFCPMDGLFPFGIRGQSSANPMAKGGGVVSGYIDNWQL